jgi:hypothetical protein
VEVIIVLVFISLVLVAGALLFLAVRIRGGDFEHGDRLSLLPLEGDEAPGEVPTVLNPHRKGEAPDGE